MSNELSKLRNDRIYKFNKVKSMVFSGVNAIYLYDSLALREVFDKFQKKQPEIYHPEYEPNPTKYQYDLEMYIFLNYEDLKRREIELRKDNEILLFGTNGATLLRREEHLLNAASIRWREKITNRGEAITTLAITPWLADLFYGVSNNQNVNIFGGAGQGKTYGVLALMCMAYDHFIHTTVGAQCTVSTVSKTKLESSAWSYINRLYMNKVDYKYSLYAQQAYSAGDRTFRRKGSDGKYLKEGGTIKGVLLQRGIKDARVVDKLTGCHDPIARIYLLDEAQSTDDAPLEAYTNMFLHPKYKFFIMSGNYESTGDLLDRNVEPINGWNNVDENTHMWQSRLRSLSEDLGQTSLTIHFNNDLSPAILDPEMEKKYGKFMPTRAKRDALYPTEESRKTYKYKRFWVGFRYEREQENRTRVIPDNNYLNEYDASLKSEVYPLVFLGSFDSAPGSVDRNLFNVTAIGLNRNNIPIIWPYKIIPIKKPQSQLEYYQTTCNEIITIMKKYKIPNDHLIMDFTQFTALVEMLSRYGIICHHIIYQQKCPDGKEVNKITKIKEDAIDLPPIKTLTESGFEKQISMYAHEKIKNRITLGAYVFKLFIESRQVRGINRSLLDGVSNNDFEKEFLERDFICKPNKTRGIDEIGLDDKDIFKTKYKFSPDILDTVFQVFYLLYVKFKLRPGVKGLGLLEYKKEEKEVDSVNKVWQSRLRRF